MAARHELTENKQIVFQPPLWHSLHDLRRTCAKLCRKSGGDLEQIQMLLGHASIQTTEKYLGMQQNLVEAVNDKLEIVDAES